MISKNFPILLLILFFDKYMQLTIQPHILHYQLKELESFGPSLKIQVYTPVEHESDPRIVFVVEGDLGERMVRGGESFLWLIFEKAGNDIVFTVLVWTSWQASFLFALWLSQMRFNRVGFLMMQLIVLSYWNCISIDYLFLNWRFFG